MSASTWPRVGAQKSGAGWSHALVGFDLCPLGVALELSIDIPEAVVGIDPDLESGEGLGRKRGQQQWEASAKSAACLANRSLKKTFTACPKMIGSETWPRPQRV